MDAEKVKTAEDALAALEAPKHRFHHARHDLKSLKSLAVPQSPALAKMHADMIAAATSEESEAQKAYQEHATLHEDKDKGAGNLVRNIDVAAQVVLDARGEKHTDQAFVGGSAHVG